MHVAQVVLQQRPDRVSGEVVGNDVHRVVSGQRASAPYSTPATRPQRKRSVAGR
jgi:hypothetical protein